jgi:hypothetical protein
MLKKILFADVANNKGMYYTREGLEKIKSDYEKDKENIGHYFGVFDPEESIPDFVHYGDSEIINIRKIAFTVESMQINKKNELIADIRLMETTSGKALKQLKNHIVFRTSSWGFVSKHGKVVVERLISINAFPKDLDSFKEIDE